MADISRTQVTTILLPIALIVVVVPVAVYIGLNWDDWRNESNQDETAVAGEPGSPASPTVAGELTVVMKDLKFATTDVEADAGTPLRWQNEDNTSHHVKIDGLTFDSGTIEPGDSAQFTVPAEPGDYDFECTIHPNTMTGTLTIR